MCVAEYRFYSVCSISTHVIINDTCH